MLAWFRRNPITAVLTILLVIAVAAFIGGILTGCGSPKTQSRSSSLSASSPTPYATPSPRVTISATPAPLLHDQAITLPTDGWAGWALAVDGRITGGQTNEIGRISTTTESMVKAWIAADALRSRPDPSPALLDQIRAMIRDSDNDAAEAVYRADGRDQVIHRMIQTCGLAETQIISEWWAKTDMTAADAARLGLCVADGRAAGAHWTPWLLEEMRQVRGEGHFGIPDGLPANTEGWGTVAVKNGWTLHGDDGMWHVNCLAIGNRWVLAVMQQYKAEYGLSHGAQVCADVASQLAQNDAAALGRGRQAGDGGDLKRGRLSSYIVSTYPQL